jgi:hypothetical protein
MFEMKINIKIGLCMNENIVKEVKAQSDDIKRQGWT